LKKSLVLQDNGMAAKSLTATPAGIQQINRALTDRGWSREDLAKECDCSRQPAVKFCSGKPVSKKLFVSFCNALDLDWEAVSGLQTFTNTEIAPDTTPDLNNLVQTVRGQVHTDIKTRCGTMRVLDMEQPIGLGDIYTSVNILKKLSKNQRPPRDEWLKHDPENFDRFLLGQVHQPQIPGLQAVEEHRQLMILGKPGAGKTTFMKRLAILCNEGEFQPQRVSIFVTLREYAEAEGKTKLQTYIQNQWETCEVKEADALEAILKAGQALILLDGLDEVKENDHDRVLQDIKTFTQIQELRGCQCVMTCRVDALEYMFDSFTYVEIADFDKDQIVDFSAKWFATRQEPRKTKIFIEKLNHKDNEPIRELAVTPILLTLLCLIFEETSEFPRNRSDFYRQGVDWLLKKWDDRRGIKRDIVYKRLSLPRKKEMLSQFAFEAFERGDYLFKQATVEQHIIRYIRSLPGASEDEDILHLDEEAVLKSITAQHGLLIERARGLYSFSHLTFQEYFTAQHIVDNTNTLDQALQNLADHVTEKRYREVFLLVTEMLLYPDILLLKMKQSADELVSVALFSDRKIQSFLTWLRQKTIHLKVSCNPAAIRAFYFNIMHEFAELKGIDYYFNPQLELAHKLESRLASRHGSLFPILPLDFEIDLRFLNVLARGKGINSSVTCKESFPNLFSWNQTFDLDHIFHDQAFDLDNIFHESLQIDSELVASVSSLKDDFFKGGNSEEFYPWCLKDGVEWLARFRLATIRHRNIGHDWQFNSSQLEILDEYYKANLLLVDCLNSDCYVTKATRQYIEDTLLLPLSEIEKYPIPDAIANL
jgi:predicted NACHT family NTPase